MKKVYIRDIREENMTDEVLSIALSVEAHRLQRGSINVEKKFESC